jgi:hypothetical protein
MEGITPFQSGRPLLSEITADKLNRILSEIKRNRPVVAAPLSARVTGDGTCISLLKQPVGGTPTTRQPWDLIAFTDPESESENPPYKIRVQPGTLNNILPSNWDEEFTANKDTTYFAFAQVATDGLAITGVTIQFDTTPPSLQSPEKYGIAGSVDILFGVFRNGGNRVIGSGNIGVNPDRWLLASADPAAAPGESPYDIYYLLK